MAKLTTKFKSLKKTTKVDFATYLGVIAAFIVVTVLQNGGMLNRKTLGLLVPICCYMSMAVSLNLTVGILGELSLGHAGFMSVGAFSGVGYDASGLHILFNVSGTKTIDDLGLDATGYAIIKGAQGATGTKTIAGLTAGFILVMVTLIIVLNLTRSRAGRAIMAIRDNPIAAQSVGLNLTKYKLMAFVTSAALAGAAGALYGLNYSSLQSVKFNFNTSILVLVFVVLGGLGNIWGSLLSAAALTILPEALRQFADYRMLVYAIVLIFVMLATNNPRFKAFFAKLLPRRHSAEEKEV